MKNLSINRYLILFLVFVVFSSKNLLIFNEETLVLIAFFSFLLFIYYYYNENITSFLNEKADSIMNELQNMISVKTDSLFLLEKEHKKVISSTPSLQYLKNFIEKSTVENNEKFAGELSYNFSKKTIGNLKDFSIVKQDTVPFVGKVFPFFYFNVK